MDEDSANHDPNDRRTIEDRRRLKNADKRNKAIGKDEAKYPLRRDAEPRNTGRAATRFSLLCVNDIEFRGEKEGSRSGPMTPSRRCK